jgi:hypothetical protein
MTQLPDHPFVATDLPTLGISRSELKRALAGGRIRRPLHGVYCPAHLPDTVEVRARCAALVVPPYAVICDRTAAWLWGVDCFDYSEKELLPKLELVSTGGNDRIRRQEVYGGKRDLRPDEICEIEGVRVTTPVRTACDLACLRGRNAAKAVYDAFARRFGLTCADYEMTLRRFRGRRGVKQARELAQYADGRVESAGESWTLMTIRDDGLEPPTPQVWVELPGYGRVRLDTAYEHLRIAVEYDGEEFHSSAEDRAADARRRDALARAGWIVIVVRKSDFTAEASERWLGELRTAIADRRAEFKRVYSRGEDWTQFVR